MARNSRKQPTATRRSTLLAAVLVFCCALSLAFISTAAARREHTKPDPTQPAPAEAGTPAASGQTGTESTPAPAPAPAPAESGTSSHGSGQGQGNTGKGHGSQGNAPSGTAPARHDHHGSSPSTHGSSSTPNTSTGTGVQPAATGQQPASTSASETSEADANAQAKHKKETKPKHPKEPGKKNKGKSGKGSGSGEGESETGSGTGTGGEESAVTSTPSTPPLVTPTLEATSALAAEPTAAAATAATTPTPTAATGTTTAATGARATRAPRHAKAVDRPGATKPHAGVDAFAAAGAAPALATNAAAASNAEVRLPRKGASGNAAKPRSRPSPLVTTITKIVNVVPVAVRMLIALLLGLALLLALRSRLAALRARRLERQRAQLLEDVGLLQAALLPVPPARLGPVGTSVAYQPAAGPGAGGDFYDVFALTDGQLAVIVGDVSGHGRQALPHTALVRFTLRAYLEAGMSPRDALQTAGAVLERQLGGVFATVVLATYQPRERVLVYACAGHPPPVVLGWTEDPSSSAANGAVASAHAITPLTVSASPPIGVGIRTGTRQTTVSVPGRAQICFYTDGLTEARVGSELFGTERLIDTLAELGPTASAAAVLERVADLADARPDDMAACLLNIEGDEHPPVVLVDELELDREEALSGRTERFLLACGVERPQLAETMRAASLAAGPSSKVVLEAHHTSGPPEVTLQREQVAYLHARRANMEVAL
jgi:serine phosphatase RsbU (regulator of sigma subunit)